MKLAEEYLINIKKIIEQAKTMPLLNANENHSTIYESIRDQRAKEIDTIIKNYRRDHNPNLNPIDPTKRSMYKNYIK